jgi:DNA processing protein
MNNESAEKFHKVDYPYTLKNIPNIPESMYIRGKIPKTQKYVCIVGSRSFSPYGEEALKYIISGLKGLSITIVSGLAIGIDTIAHRLAIQNNLPTIAFPGSGLDDSVIYPREHLDIAKTIVDSGGCLLSPFEPLQTATHWTFPVRNKLMSAISNAVLIVEAKKRSGTLLTAEYALDFGKDILAIPNSIFSPHSYGPNLLIKKGAFPITCPEDLLDILDMRNTKDIVNDTEARGNSFSMTKDLSSLDEIDKKIYRLIESGTHSKTVLSESLKLNSSELSIRLSRLEIDDFIRITEGEIFIRNAR